MNKTDLICANRDPERQILKCQALIYHVLLTREDINPNNPKERTHRERISVFTKEEYDANEKQARGRNPFNWVQVSGWDKARVIHLPELVDEATRQEVTEYWDSLKRPVSNEGDTNEALKNRIKKLENKLKMKSIS